MRLTVFFSIDPHRNPVTGTDILPLDSIREAAYTVSWSSAGLLTYGIESTNRAFPSRIAGKWRFPAFVADHSGGSVTDLHRLPFSGSTEPPNTIPIHLSINPIMNPISKLSNKFSKY